MGIIGLRFRGSFFGLGSARVQDLLETIFSASFKDLDGAFMGSYRVSGDCS